CPASNIATDEVGVHALKIGGSKNPSCQNAIAEAWSEALNLILHSLEHVHCRPVRHMAISPGRVFACWRARIVEQTRLGQQHEWTIGMLSVSDRLFRGRNLVKLSTQMYRRCSQAVGGLPWYRRVQRVVHLEGGGPVAEVPQLAFVPLR